MVLMAVSCDSFPFHGSLPLRACVIHPPPTQVTSACVHSLRRIDQASYGGVVDWLVGGRHELRQGSRGCGGGLFDQDGTSLKDVPLKEISVQAQIHNFIADVTCKLVYKNDSKDLVETQFVLPIDADAAVYHFEAEICKKRLVAKCQERLEAKETYQEAVNAGHSAFYMEEDELMGDTFTMKVGNIPPMETAVIRLQYFCQLQAQNETKDSGECAVAVFVLPSVLNPRYTPPCKTKFLPF
ncbi:unnamed protein product [Schistocephalus solidus]|uniref:VIT domain-containing protein n=1 Tax=Schistocephalus solidus TaxID=70667 RepID=A0A183TUB5_SCHSO|nr:unnamed protein product [Schistocephalus solidus]